MVYGLVLTKREMRLIDVEPDMGQCTRPCDFQDARSWAYAAVLLDTKITAITEKPRVGRRRPTLPPLAAAKMRIDRHKWHENNAFH